jgi:hypothetical protein
MAVGKPSRQETRNRSEIDPKNAIRVGMDDLLEDDQCRIREEMKKDLEELEAIRMREKLAC